ncbi:hypothetical protein PVAND_010041 [Polypedilum vanderplanki]|uniref:LsmAD domain-containing protein n=1 Tax=Polypedilum vanderplanki TaxID=319348 RepID=A0A9J6CEM8_POLVA|nr:hypothetical protein PVAND_010041 [Polypedilum vanderplanki]
MNKTRKNNPNRAGQGSNNNNNRSSPRSRGPIAEGVYNNSHFLHAAASQVGNNVRVKTKGGVVVEGIFRTFSENFHIALEVPHRYQNGAEDEKINVNTVQDNLIIKLCDIVTIEAKDVDLEYPIRDAFLDSSIASRVNGPNRHGIERELQPWNDGIDNMNGDAGKNLELDTKTNGWDATEMFQYNEKEYGIKTTFKDNLESYTVQIDRKDTQDYRKQELEAERIANEIENNPTTKERLDVENGDEEAAFAAVIRPDDQNNSNSNMMNNNNDKMTPPPASSQKYIPKQQRNQGGKMMSNNNKIYSKPMQTSGSGQQQQQQQQQQQPVVQQTLNAGGFKTMTINPLPQFNQPPPSHYVPSSQQNQQSLNNADGNKINGDGRGEMVRDNSNNNNNNSNNSNNKSMPPPRTNMRIMNPHIPVSFSEPPPNLTQVSNQHMGKPISMHIPPPHLQTVQVQTPDGQQSTAVHVLPQPVVVVHQQIPIHAAPPPQPQRQQRDPTMRSRNDEIRSLRQFHNDFQMAPQQQQQQTQTSAPPQVPQQTSQTIQTMPPPQRPDLENVGQQQNIHATQNIQSAIDASQQQQQQQPHMGNKSQHVNNNTNVNHHVTHRPTPSSTPHDKSHGSSTTPPQSNTPQQQQNVNNSSNVNSSLNSSNSGSTTNSSESPASSGTDKPSGAKKTLGLNPHAKPFTPRNPSTPNQSRPHTPQTPGPMAQAAAQPMPPPQQQQVAYAPSGHLLYCVIPQPPQQRPAQPPTLARKTQFHQFQVTQATGQPIFNPPVPPQAVMPYHPSQMQTVQSQTYPPAIRMYSHEAQPQPHLTSYLVPTPPSTTPSPGQPHQQTFHPGPQPSPAGPPTQAFQQPGQYVMLMHSNAPPFVYNQPNPQSFQIVSSAMPQQQQQQHPAQ